METFFRIITELTAKKQEVLSSDQFQVFSKL